MKVVYLDFDGVLHPAAVYQRKGQPYLDGTYTQVGMSLFMHCEKLAEVLKDFPDVRIVLSTSWVHVKGFSYARDRLTSELQKLCIGATFHSSMKKDRYDHTFGLMTRYQQIITDGFRRKPTHWVAIDDDEHGWPDIEFDHLVHTDEEAGLGDPQKLLELRKILESWQ